MVKTSVGSNIDSGTAVRPSRSVVMSRQRGRSHIDFLSSISGSSIEVGGVKKPRGRGRKHDCNDVHQCTHTFGARPPPPELWPPAPTQRCVSDQHNLLGGDDSGDWVLRVYSNARRTIEVVPASWDWLKHELGRRCVALGGKVDLEFSLSYLASTDPPRKEYRSVACVVRGRGI